MKKVTFYVHSVFRNENEQHKLVELSWLDACFCYNNMLADIAVVRKLKSVSICEKYEGREDKVCRITDFGENYEILPSSINSPNQYIAIPQKSMKPTAMKITKVIIIEDLDKVREDSVIMETNLPDPYGSENGKLSMTFTTMTGQARTYVYDNFPELFVDPTVEYNVVTA